VAQFFALMQRATLMLDTIGFSGFNTALQGLECGLPIVAYEGKFMRGRLASGLLRRVGLEDWVAVSHADFIDKAMRLVVDESLRLELRQQIAQRRRLLFDDLEPVRALERVLFDAVASAGV
jgi:predicted O-linked N-acetylglucosamine transferase (SPINDLY family)